MGTVKPSLREREMGEGERDGRGREMGEGERETTQRGLIQKHISVRIDFCWVNWVSFCLTSMLRSSCDFGLDCESCLADVLSSARGNWSPDRFCFYYHCYSTGYILNADLK